MDTINEKGLDSSDVLTQLFGDINGVNAVLALTANEGKQFATVMEAMAEKGGSASTAFETIKKNDPTLAFAQMTQAVAALSRAIGDQVLVAIRPFVEALQQILGAVASWAQAHPETMRVIVGLAAGLAGLLLVVAAGGVAMMALGAAISALAAVGLPVIAALGLVALPLFAALVAVAGVLVANWDAIKAWALGNWPAIKESLTAAFGEIWGAIQRAGSAIRETLVGAFQSLAATAGGTFPPVSEMIRIAAAWISETLIPAVQSAVQWFIKFGVSLVQAVIENWPKIKENLVALWNMLGALWDMVSRLIAVALDLAQAFLKMGSGKDIQNTGDALGAWLDTLKSVLGTLETIFSVIAKILSWAEKVTDAFAKWNPPDWLKPAFKGAAGSMPGFGSLVPFMAEGGIITRPTLAVLGEAGPEAVIPLSRGSVPVDFSGRAGGQTPSVTINITQQPGQDARALAREVSAYITRAWGYA